jgi:hypothetical protein
MKPKWILAVAAVLLLVTGVACRRWVGQLSSQHDKVERLPLLNAPDFRKAKPGAEVLIAGTVSDRNPVLFEDFVCLITYRFARPEATQPWVEETRRTPSVWLAAADGEVHVVNANYRLEAVESARELEVTERGLHTWQSRPEREAGTDATATRAATGFGRGDRVLAFGKVVSSEGVAELDATWIYGGKRSQWLEESARDYRVARLVPWTLWALALVFIALAIVRR